VGHGSPGGQMSQTACFLCGSQANRSDELDRQEGFTVVTCPNCGWYRLKPRDWTADERLSLAAYVQHEKSVGRRPTTITEDNYRLLIRLGERIRAKKTSAGQ
jgi:NAD-dependent SIR2 family protein deacetylase